MLDAEFVNAETSNEPFETLGCALGEQKGCGEMKKLVYSLVDGVILLFGQHQSVHTSALVSKEERRLRPSLQRRIFSRELCPSAGSKRMYGEQILLRCCFGRKEVRSVFDQ